MLKKKKSVTLTEILVGAVILALVFGGLLASFLATRGYVTRANKRLISSNFVRRTFDNLYNTVRADHWDAAGTPLYASGTAWQNHNFNEVNLDLSTGIDNIQYSGSYQVRKVPGQDYREIKVILNYPVE